MGKRDENPFLNTFEFRCGDLPPEDVPKAAQYLFLKGLMELSKTENPPVDLSGYELVPFNEVVKK